MDQELGEHRSISSRAMANVAAPRDFEGVHSTQLLYSLEKAVKEMPIWIQAATDGQEGQGRYKYASLKDILKTVKPKLAECGIMLLQGCLRSYSADEGGGAKTRIVPVYTDLVHVPTGEFRRVVMEIPLGNLTPKAMGSAVSYGRRYGIPAALGLATDEADDDGADAMPFDFDRSNGDSKALLGLKSEMSKCTKEDDLLKLINDPKFKKRSGALVEEERGLLLAHYTSVKAEVQDQSKANGKAS
ncbi:MAG: ERF family protein [Filomicrobium sp.]